ncbi:M56 family metallopeptidase [Flavobacterium microcysteis]|uniref:M56 family metallopeptidase n=1 Tax=Flavobacterium microcysteis TaxID=2596891 RepID=A0A501Q8C0_9FLAO|nr:M56 family metallopeptidase [Flavobacterium microcysteis]TPD68347.1 M56 family metallopeptidase [Flavobacterium microcysteis]
MEAFLLKSTACLAFLFGIYYLFFEKEKMHQFNRFFLLFSLLFSLAIPFITITVYHEIVMPIQVPTIIEQIPRQAPIIVEESTNYTTSILWILYALITFILAIRLFLNINKVRNKIKNNRKEKISGATLVLIEEKILPYTFLNYIFINKKDYENRNIEEELYTHELTHARQKHTFDILFIELLKTIFWFNPILIVYKKAIQLNHEFLADEKVVKSYNNVPSYQNLLLEKASWNSNFYLASNLNFSVTKKRLIMMTKTTSKSRALLKKIAVLPVLAGLIFISCIENSAIAKENKSAKAGVNWNDAVTYNPQNMQSLNDIQEREASYFAGVRFIIYKSGIQTKKKLEGRDILFDKVYEELTTEDKERLKPWISIIPKGYVKKSPTQNELDGFKNQESYAVWIDGVNVKNSELDKFKPADIAFFSGSVILKNARTKKHPQPFQYWFYTHDYFDKNEMGKAPEKYVGDKMEIFKTVIKKTA